MNASNLTSVHLTPSGPHRSCRIHRGRSSSHILSEARYAQFEGFLHFIRLRVRLKFTENQNLFERE
jgi:hypothetical protein